MHKNKETGTKAIKPQKAAKTAKAVKGTKPAPKWGTKEWIMAYPWSQMDKDRRSRVRKVLHGTEDVELLSFNMSYDLAGFIARLSKKLNKADIEVQPSLLKETIMAATRIDDFLKVVQDVLIANALYKRWCDGGKPDKAKK